MIRARDLPGLVLLAACAGMIASCSPAPTYRGEDRAQESETEPAPAKVSAGGDISRGDTLSGFASYYGEKFAGRKTANGEVFDPEKLTAAHRELPFGTILEVTLVSTGRSIRVRINDRGPYARDRILDLSREAARRIGLIESGVGYVEATIVSLGGQ
ncbi:MAG: Endolytic peptidoglycan transglycosylase RlpA [Calditrichaeota bacterium]|nr:Endolytic peptidoglycan transglycosylase RlpA [Calditrichota bacterium]